MSQIRCFGSEVCAVQFGVSEAMATRKRGIELEGGLADTKGTLSACLLVDVSAIHC